MSRYKWGFFPDDISDTVTSVGATDGNMVIYESELNPLFYDVSVATEKITRDFTSMPEVLFLHT